LVSNVRRDIYLLAPRFSGGSSTGIDLDEALSEIAKEGKIGGDVRKKLEEKCGSKFKQAEKLVNSMAVKRYVFTPSGRVVWIVVGREKEYFMIPRLYCQCDNFYIRVVIKRETDLCYHLLAQSIAEKLGRYETFEVSDNDFIRLNNDWKRQSV
jgi:predicted nucleic acid-binding Zn finger protein